MNAKGIGIIIAPRHPNNVPAHWTPRLVNIWREKRGKHAPTADRRIVLAANTEAALRLSVDMSLYGLWAIGVGMGTYKVR